MASNEPRIPLLKDGDLLLMSYYYPPMSVGTSFAVGTLLEGFDDSGLIVFCGKPSKSTVPTDPTLKPRGSLRRFDVPAWWPDADAELRLAGRTVRLRWRALGNLLVALRVAAAAIATLRRESTRALVVVYPKQHFLLAGLLVATVVRKPLLVYFTDVYVEGLERGRRTARLIERLVARRANVVFAMSSAHREHIESRIRAHVREPRVVELPHLYSEAPAEADRPVLVGAPAIVFTGAIYDAQADAVERLASALPLLEPLDPHLHLLTQSSPAELRAWGIEPCARVHVRTATRVEARAAQRAADILFLPLAFGAKEQVLRTASPSKMPEYLAAGRPILVHAPPDSYLARYAREHGFAEVVDDPDAAALAAAVRRLATDPDRCEELVAAAERTLVRHRIESVAGTFREAVEAAVEARSAA
jgi:glycosyltransferase involved in cell wall biosynthesis